MNVYDLGAILIREIEHNDIRYVFLEWADPKTGESSGFAVHWVDGGKCLSVSIPAGYTDGEMLQFCDYETVYAE